MIINLTTPMSDDKERERRTKAVLDAIERYTEERMNDENTNGSRSGGQPALKPCPFCGSLPKSGDSTYGYWLIFCSDENNCLAQPSVELKTEAQAIAAWNTRQPTQGDALRDQILQECLVKLRDVQGTEAPKQYACNLIKRIERVLLGQSK